MPSINSLFCLSLVSFHYFSTKPFNFSNSCYLFHYREENRKNFSPQNPLKDLSVKSLEHVSQSHINYVFFWLGLLKLEEHERKRNRSFDISDLWHLDVMKRFSIITFFYIKLITFARYKLNTSIIAEKNVVIVLVNYV